MLRMDTHLRAYVCSFGTKLDAVRAAELKYLMKYMSCQLLSRFLWTVVPAATAVATFATYVVRVILLFVLWRVTCDVWRIACALCVTVVARL